LNFTIVHYIEQLQDGITNSLRNKFIQAIIVAYAGENEKFKLGAIVFKGKTPLSSGTNLARKTSPDMIRFGKPRPVHAEQNALISHKHYDTFKGTDLVVVRLGRDGKIRMSKPCSECTKLIEAAKIKKVYFTNEAGNVEMLYVSRR